VHPLGGEDAHFIGRRRVRHLIEAWVFHRVRRITTKQKRSAAFQAIIKFTPSKNPGDAREYSPLARQYF